MDVLFIEIAAVVITAGLLSLVMHMLRQPLIIAYILTGLIVGPSLLGLAGSSEVFSALSEVGIAFLLFLVGINLNWRKIQDVGKVSFLAGFGQVSFTTLIGFIVGLAIGFSPITAFFLALAFAFSSTIVIVKVLSDKGDLDRFYGRISIGVLIVQDIIAMVVLLIVGAMQNGGGLGTILALSGMKAAMVLGGLWLVSRYILPHVFQYAARSQEMLFLTALSWCFAIAAFLHLVGFGIEIGALLAGISIAGSEYHREIESKIEPLRDFFLVIFFIVLGTHVDFSTVPEVIVPSILLSLFIMIGNPIIVLLIMRLLGYHPRTGTMVGLGMAQVSEFSFILLGVAIAGGFVESQILTLSTLVGIITIAGSTYLMKYDEQIYEAIHPALRWMEGVKMNGQGKKRVKAPKVIVFGFEHLAEALLPAVKSLGLDFVVVDFDPVRLKALRAQGVPVEYGDAGNKDFLEYLHTEKADLVISTIPDITVNEDITRFIKDRKARTTIVLTAKGAKEATRLYDIGANFVILPNTLGGELFGQLLKKKQTKKTPWNVLARKYRAAMAEKSL